MAEPIYDAQLYRDYGMNPEDIDKFMGYGLCGLLGLDPERYK